MHHLVSVYECAYSRVYDVCACVCARMSMCVECLYVRMGVGVYVCLRIYMRVCVRVCVCVCVRMRMCVRACGAAFDKCMSRSAVFSAPCNEKPIVTMAIFECLKKRRLP